MNKHILYYINMLYVYVNICMYINIYTYNILMCICIGVCVRVCVYSDKLDCFSWQQQKRCFLFDFEKKRIL